MGNTGWEVIAVTTTAKPIDRRREKADAAGTAAGQAQTAVTDIDNQLKTIASLTDQQEQSLRRAQDEAARLKQALKAAAKRKAELVKQRKKAVVRAGRASAKAKAAEAKYDKEVLAEIVRREKEKDRQPAKTGPAQTGPTQTAADPAPEKENAATATARGTAARKTAAAARSTR